MAETDWKNVQRNKTTGQYRTTDGGSGGASNFADLEDVDFDNLQDGQVPKYDAQNQKWINSNESGGGGNVDDVEVNGVSVLDQTDKIAKIKSYKEVTISEYQALPDSKLTDNVMYCIKDIGGANQFPPLIYSDEEREIGVWRDGKPLYQKTVICTATQQLNNSSWTQIQWNNEPNNIYQLIDAELNAVDGVPNTVGNIRFLYDNNHICGASNVTSGNVIYSGQIVTFKYTKTTDTPGSGTWTTDGTYAKHYSTEEKVIGTWIDGKPLYEKVCEVSSGITGGSFTYAHNIDNLKEVVKADCNYFYSGASCPAYIYPVNNTSSGNSYINGEYTVAYNGCTSTIIALTIGSSIASSLNKISTILCYTKTTD